MKNPIPAILILIVIVIALLAGRTKKTSSVIFFVPEGISNARVANLNLKQEPDEELGILDVRKIKFPAIQETTGKDGSVNHCTGRSIAPSL